MKQLSLQINNMLLEYFAGIWKNRMFFCYALIVCIVSFGYELFHYTWGVDDEIFEIMKGPAYWWATQGRFSSGYLLGLFFGNLCVPFFSLFFSQLCMLVAYYLFFIGKEEVNGFKHYIGVSLFLSNPVLFYAYTFNCLTPITGLGFLLSAAAVILFEKRNL